MNRFLITACAAALGLMGTAGAARAQLVFDPSGSPGGTASPFFTSPYSPFYGYGGGYSSPFSSFYSPFSSYSGGVPGLGGAPGLYSPFGSTVYSPYGYQSTSPFSYASQYTMPRGNGLGTTANYYSPYGSQTFANMYSPFSFANRTLAANYSPYGTAALSGYYSPYGGMFSQTTSNLFGGGATRTFGYNPFNGFTSGTGLNGITRPTIVNPSMGFGGSNYGGYNNAYNNLLSREMYATYLNGYDNLMNRAYNSLANNSGSWNYSEKYSGSYNGKNYSNSWNYSTRNTGNFNGAANAPNNRTYSGTYTGSGSGLLGGYNYNTSYDFTHNYRHR